MESDVRAGITQRDFVTFYETCKKPGGPISVRGARLEAGEAIVLMKIQGVEKSRTMVYEDGSWNMQATDDFAARLGQPLPSSSPRRPPPGSARGERRPMGQRGHTTGQ